jgi:glyceraldehyde-3-phosphate dehydrogenase (NADP+)
MRMLIDGEWREGTGIIPVTDPYTGETVDTVPLGTRADAEAAVTAAVEGFHQNRSLSTGERARVLRRTAELLEGRQEEFAVLIAREGSKTIREARKEVYRCTQTLRVSGEEATRLLGETISFDQQEGSENRKGYFYRMPIGVVAAITPFNDPLNLVAHKVGPAIAGGNGVVVKPATVTPLSALKLAELFLEAGLPRKVLNVVTGPGGEVGDALVSDRRVRMVSFTGGVEAGLAVMGKAGHRPGRRGSRRGRRELRLRGVLGGRTELHRRAADLRPGERVPPVPGGLRRTDPPVQGRAEVGGGL